MAEAIISYFRPPIKQPHPIESVLLIPSGGGIFEVEVDGEVVFSKFKVGRHANAEEIIETIRGRLS